MRRTIPNRSTPLSLTAYAARAVLLVLFAATSIFVVRGAWAALHPDRCTRNLATWQRSHDPTLYWCDPGD